MGGEFHGRHEFCTAAVGLRIRLGVVGSDDVLGYGVVWEVVAKMTTSDFEVFLDGVFLLGGILYRLSNLIWIGDWSCWLIYLSWRKCRMSEGQSRNCWVR